jgi:hypothetical protein
LTGLGEVGTLLAQIGVLAASKVAGVGGAGRELADGSGV